MQVVIIYFVLPILISTISFFVEVLLNLAIKPFITNLILITAPKL